MMAVSEYHLDTRIRRKHVPLLTQQRRLRHLRSITGRNLVLKEDLENGPNLAFTLHSKLALSAFYNSEFIPNDMNPCWKDFESSNFPNSVDIASSYVIVRVWNTNGEKQLLIEWVVFFSGLVYLGEQIPKEGKNFKPNTLLFGMSEGYYGGQDCYQHSAGIAAENSVKDTLEAEMAGLRTSYTLSTLSRIKTVERAIKQTEASVQRRKNSIGNRLQKSRELHSIQSQQELLRIQISVLKTELNFREKSLSLMEKDVSADKDELVKKKSKIKKEKEHHTRIIDKCLEFSKIHNECRERFLKTEAQLNFRRKELISELCCIYPIVEFPDHNGGFSIHNVHLPNSENFSGHDDTMISVALGYVCHITLMISQFLNVPLRYPISFYGSRSTITDHISSALPDKTREFPLYLKNKDRRCFEYGVFLLNKNISQLRIFCRLSTKDLSATLPNLSSMLELRLSTTSSDPQMIVQKESNLSVPTETAVTNGLSESPNTLEQSGLLKTVDSELEFLQSEIQAMLPNSTNIPTPPIAKNLSKEASTALSGSLDKGLNDIKLLEKSIETLELESKTDNSNRIKLLRQSSHHSSYPNLIDSPSEGLVEPSAFVWTEDVTSKVKPPLVLNDSIFYIPTATEPSSEDPPRTKSEDVVDFSADLSLRADQLANKAASFQMQRLRTSSDTDKGSSQVQG